MPETTRSLRSVAWNATLPTIVGLLALAPWDGAGARPEASPPPASANAGRCAALAGLTLPGIGRVTTAAPGPAMLPPGPYGQPALTLPAHCEVNAIMQERTGRLGQRYAIRYRLRLPDSWNGGLLFQGGGGTNGEVGNAVGSANTAGPSALARGFAVVSQDSGHDNRLNFDPAWGGATVFGTDPVARANYGHASLPLVTGAARLLVARYYGDGPRHSYFLGCSKGGQEGMAAAQRYPALFDGIIAAAPGFALPRAALNEAWSVQQLGRLASTTQPGPVTVASIARTFSAVDMGLVRKAVLDACDMADGLADGITADFRQCTRARVRQRLNAAVCRPGGPAACLSGAQVDTLDRIMGGPRDAAGRLIYATWAWDGGIGSPMWSLWRTGSEQLPAFDIALGGASLPVVFSVPARRVGVSPDAILATQMALSMPQATAAIYRKGAPFLRSAWDEIGMHSANLDAFMARGGKLLVPHGVADPVFSIEDTIAWWDRVHARYGARTDGAVRVMPVPGMAHCGGGPATSSYDILAALTDWVERGRAPDTLVATAGPDTPWPGRTRPLCSWPRVARYRAGNPERAESFVCDR